MIAAVKGRVFATLEEATTWAAAVEAESAGGERFVVVPMRRDFAAVEAIDPDERIPFRPTMAGRAALCPRSGLDFPE